MERQYSAFRAALLTARVRAASDEIRKRLRKRFERRGVHDERANRRAHQQLQRDEANRPRKVG